MVASLRSYWRSLVSGLWFVPLVIVIAFGLLGFVSVRLDERLVGHDTPWVFGGGTDAARTVLTAIAGSVITVAGIAFSITMIVLQLASSQFSPRVLPNFLADRLTQVTVGAFIGDFVFCLIGLRAVGGRSDFVPRLTVTEASAFAVLAMLLLIVFLHHLSTMIQVSHVAGRIGHQTLEALDRLYPEPFGEATGEEAKALVEEWRTRGESRAIVPVRPGYVQQVDLGRVAELLRGTEARVYASVAPGDFVSAEQPALEIWPASAARDVDGLRRAIVVRNERDFLQDAAFGVRQLGDIGLRAISPGVNDPTTAITCVGYIRSILERLAARDLPAGVRRVDGLTIVARHVEFGEYLETLAELARYAEGDARLVRQLVRACAAVARAARRSGADDRAREAEELLDAIVEQARGEARGSRERELVTSLAARVREER